MCIETEEQRTRDPLLAPVAADGLSDGCDVRFVEATP
jgi:hypothetical protein